jgi:hypothetical protein
VAKAAWRVVQRSERPDSEKRVARTRYEGAELLARAAQVGLPPSLELPVSVVALGHDAWLHLPVELFASLGSAVRARSLFARTRIVCYADGYFGYVADEGAHQAGVYEAAASLFDASAGRQLVSASVALLNEVAAEAQ